MKKSLACIFVLTAFFIAETAFAESKNEDKKLSVFVSIIPQKYFVEQIGGQNVSVNVMVQPGANPATYEPKPKQMAALSEAQIYFSISVPFESTWLPKLSKANPSLKMVACEQGIEKIPMLSHHHHDGDEHDKETHDHKGIYDPHVWLSPPLVVIVARNITTALSQADSANHAYYEENYRTFAKKLIDLDFEFLQLFATNTDKKNDKSTDFLVFHPAWGYFAKTYGLNQIPIEIEGKEPKPNDLKKLIEYATAKKISIVFIQPQFSTSSAQTIAKSINGSIAIADPLAEDWIDNMRRVAVSFKSQTR